MKKLVFFNSTMEMGGPARYINLWGNYFVDKCYQVEVVSNIDVPLFYEFDKRIEYSILGIDKFQQTYKIKAFYKIYKFLKYRKKEIFIFTKGMYVPYLYILKKLNLLNKDNKLVYVVHGGSSDFKTMYSNLFNYMIFYIFDNIVANIDDYHSYNKSINMSTRRRIFDLLIPSYFHQIEKKITYIVNPVTFRSDSISNYEKKTVLAVGRLDYIKGFDLLVNSWKMVTLQYPKWKLKIVGSGEEKDNLEKLINKLSMNDFIEMIPQQKDIKSLYLNSSIYAMTSREEGFGMVTIEAMECGLPIVAFSNVGAKYLVSNNQNGLLCDIGDIKSLATNLMLLIKSKDLRETYGKESKHLVKQFYIENIAHIWQPILEGSNE